MGCNWSSATLGDVSLCVFPALVSHSLCFDNTAGSLIQFFRAKAQNATPRFEMLSMAIGNVEKQITRNLTGRIMNLRKATENVF